MTFAFEAPARRHDRSRCGSEPLDRYPASISGCPAQGGAGVCRYSRQSGRILSARPARTAGGRPAPKWSGPGSPRERLAPGGSRQRSACDPRGRREGCARPSANILSLCGCRRPESAFPSLQQNGRLILCRSSGTNPASARISSRARASGTTWTASLSTPGAISSPAWLLPLGARRSKTPTLQVHRRLQRSSAWRGPGERMTKRRRDANAFRSVGRRSGPVDGSPPLR